MKASPRALPLLAMLAFTGLASAETLLVDRVHQEPRMAMPYQLRYGTAHGVPDDNHRTEAKRVDQDRYIVGTILHSKWSFGAYATAVTAMVKRDDTEVFTEGPIRHEKVQVGRDRPPV